MSKKKLLLIVVGSVLLVIAGGAAWMLGPALLPPKSIDVGIALDAQAPIDMPLLDSKGQSTSLAQEMGPKGIVLILVRSADWCPFCKAQLVRTKDIRPDIEKAGYSLASLSYDPPETLADFANAKGIEYAMLSDQGSKMIDALGLRDPQYGKDSVAYGVSRATILIVGSDGSVEAKYVAEDYRSRPPNEVVLSMLSKVRN